MNVYPGTMTNRKSGSARKINNNAKNSFLHCLTVLMVIGTIIGIISVFSFYYMSLISKTRNTDREINLTKRQITETERTLKTLNNEYARLSGYSHISAKIRQFRLPLAQVRPAQVCSRSMAIMTPLQASRVALPASRPTAVAENIRRSIRYSRSF